MDSGESVTVQIRAEVAQRTGRQRQRQQQAMAKEAGGPHADCITAVTSSAPTPSAPWTSATLTSTSLTISGSTRRKSEALGRPIYGQDGKAPFRKALRPSRFVQMFFNELDILLNPVLVYQQGETLEEALERVHGIAVDPEAGRARRDPMHPSLEPVADELRRPSRIMLTELATHGYIGLELLELADADLDAIANPDYRRHVARRWKPTSLLARAARAAGAYREARGADLAHVRVMGEAVLAPDSAVSLEAREDWLRSSIPQASLPDMTECVFVLRSNVKRPLRALLITAVDQAAPRDIAELDL